MEEILDAFNEVSEDRRGLEEFKAIKELSEAWRRMGLEFGERQIGQD